MATNHESSLKTRETNSLDFISDLEGGIMDNVLTRMPLRDAARTSILSRKWRYKWTSIPNLVFNRKSRSQFIKNLIPVIKSGSLPLEHHKVIVDNHLANVVDQVLLFHEGTIKKFRLCNYLEHHFIHVDRWVLFLVRHGIEELRLGFMIHENTFYLVPPSLFSCEGLKVLALGNCQLQLPPSFEGFSCLKRLDLHNSKFTEDTIERLISSCPLLEQLKLRLHNYLKAIKIHARKLKYLYLLGEFNDLAFVDTTCLAEVTVILTGIDLEIERNEQGQLDRVFGGLTSLEKLILDDYFLQLLAPDNVPEILPNRFNHLKYLKMSMNFLDSTEGMAALCLFRSSPFLQMVVIKSLEGDPFFYEEKIWEEHPIPDCKFNHLCSMIVKDISGCDGEMSFIKFVLANAPVLELMIISCSQTMQQERKEQILKSLLFFKRASSARVAFD